jgi:drug/metabolite transporter (DMT)-like permease
VTLPLVLPLLAAVVYASGALLVKRSADLGVGVWRTAFVANLLGALLFQPLLFVGGTVHPDLWWQPVLVGIFFLVGQCFTFISLDRGDVSVATPVLGLKILLVASLVTLWRGETLRWQLWAASLLATAGIALLNRSGGTPAHHHVGRTIVMAGLAAASYAVFDVLVQTWSPAWGVGRFLPIAMAVSGVLSFAFVFCFRAPLRDIPRSTWPWLLGGAGVLGGQSVLFVSTVATWGQATSANVLYSSRGLWSVLLVWVFGDWVRSREQHLGRAVLSGRLAGAVLLMSAIVLVLPR